MKNQKGQTLIEVIIAVFIMIVGVVSLVSVAITYNVMSRQSSHEIVAMNLARENIEAIRNQRDSNMLAIEAGSPIITSWDYNLFSTITTDYTVVWTLNTTTGAFASTYIPNDFTFNQTKIFQKNNIYFQNAIGTAPIGATTSVFRRLAYIYPICRDKIFPYAETVCTSLVDCPVTGTCDLANEDKVGMDVRVQVQWYENTAVKNYYLQETMYDWKY